MTAALALDPPATMTSPPPVSVPRATDEQSLAALPSAVGCARLFVRFVLERWRLFDLIDTAEAAAAEMVSDAVAATGIAVEHPSYLDLYDKQLNLVNLRLHLTDIHLIIQVWDASRTPPWPREAASQQARSRRFYVPPHGGKVVWVALDVPPALPRRAGYPRRPVPPGPARPVNPMTDLALLQRVRDGLHRLDTKPPGDGPNTDRTAREER